MQTYFIIDVETTGVDEFSKVCEVAWMEVDVNLNVLNEVQGLIDPQTFMSPSASATHGLTLDDVKDSPTIEEFFSEDHPHCYGRPLPADAVAIGHRVSFDLRFLTPYFEAPPKALDTLRWVRALYPHMDAHTLGTCIYALGLPRSVGAHRALADVHTARHLCAHICERMGVDLSKLTELSQQPFQLHTFPFGKHKGEPFDRIPRSYLRWALENLKDIDADLRYTITSHLT